MNKQFNGKKYYLKEKRWIRTTHPQMLLSHDIWNFYNPNNPILSEEIIHHKNRNTLDDRIENLEKMTRRKHISLHHIGKNHRNWRGGIKSKALYLRGGIAKKGSYYSMHLYVNSLGEIGIISYDLKIGI